MTETVRLSVSEWRKAKGYTLTEMAKKIGVSAVTWTKWEKEPSKIPIGLTEKFCTIIGVSRESVIFLP